MQPASQPFRPANQGHALSKIEQTHHCSVVKVRRDELQACLLRRLVPQPLESGNQLRPHARPLGGTDALQRICATVSLLSRPGSGVSLSGGDSRLPRKEVIQPHLPVRLPCYDFTPITDPTLDACLPLHRGLAQRLQVLPTFVV